ncbi:type II toxin-antitoxin system RelE/ParE family toxin [Bordetella ansorpii]|uniref:type II toxin-antitoxin system RelE/ParE family toxin n=1 Tax=Bordetella ansorpii TaxID=288768 RepID=UPI0012E744CA|nr:type II toxin-antitoxin system RelE/ParE family toxin [Bordetella ansorpii]
MFALRLYQTATGECPLEKWLVSLRDVQARARIRARLARLQTGNPGDCKPLREGLQELRIDHKPGYRAYFSRQGPVIVLLLCGSDKSDQRASIEHALNYLQDWKHRGNP